MYIKESGLTQAIDVINQGNKFIAERAGFADQVMREKAKSDLFYAEAEFNKNTQEFLRGLSQRNDYENFEKDLDDYLTQQNAALQKRAHNHYSGELFNQMITSQRNALQNTVQNQILAMSIKDITTQNQSTMQLNRDIMQGQVAIDANNGVINSEYANGMRDSNYTRAALLNDGKLSIQKDFYKNASNQMEAIFNKPNGTFSEVEKVIDDMSINSTYKILMLNSAYANKEGLQKAMETGEGFIDIGGEVDKKEIAKDIKKLLKNQWDAKEKELHEKNFGKITEMYAEMFTLPETQRLDYANAALSVIDTKMSGNNLDPSQRAQAVNFFKSFKESSSGAAAESKMRKQMETFIETNQEAFIQYYLDGTLDGYDARKGFENACLEDYTKLTGKTSTFDMKKDFPTISGFLDVLQKRAPDLIKGTVSDIEEIIKEAAKDAKFDNSKELQAMAVDLVWDTMMEIPLSDPEAIKKAANYLTSEAKAWHGKKLDIVRKNVKSGNSDLEVGVFGGLEKTAAEYLYEIENHPGFRYKDKNDIEKTSIFGSDETFEVADKIQRELLQKNLGIEPRSLRQEFETKTKVNKLGMVEKDARDVSANMVYTSPDGTQYKVRSPDKKDIDIYKKAPKGEWVKVNTIKQQEAEDKKDHAAEVYKQMEEFAKKVSISYMDPPPGVPSNTWISYLGKEGKNEKAIAKKLQELMLNAEENKDPRVKARLEAWLNKNGF